MGTAGTAGAGSVLKKAVLDAGEQPSALQALTVQLYCLDAALVRLTASVLVLGELSTARVLPAMSRTATLYEVAPLTALQLSWPDQPSSVG